MIKDYDNPVVERPHQGKPRTRQVLAIVEAHADDAEYGLAAKLIAEGCTAYIIRTTNDEAGGTGATPADAFLGNEKDNIDIGKVLGVQKVYDLHYRNHRMDVESMMDLRMRLIFLFRLLKVDIVTTWDPWQHYENNPDHYITGLAVEAACWMAGGNKDYPEQFIAGLEPHTVQEKYFYARPNAPQHVNRIVDISPWVETKIEAMAASRQQLGSRGARLKQDLASRGQRLPILGNNDDEANRAYIRLNYIATDRERGQRFGLQYAEEFHYVGPGESGWGAGMEEYIRKNAVPL